MDVHEVTAWEITLSGEERNELLHDLRGVTDGDLDQLAIRFPTLARLYEAL